MKTTLPRILAAAIALAVVSTASAADTKAKARDSRLVPDARVLKLGDAAPDFKLLGIDGKTYTLADFPAGKSPLLMVVFLSNHCPYSHAAETRLIPLVKEFAPKGLGVVAINPNSPEGIRIDDTTWAKVVSWLWP